MKAAVIGMVVAVVGFAVSSGATRDKENATALTPCVTISGADSRILEPACYRVTTLKQWARLWQRHKGAPEGEDYDLYSDPLSLPLVDFDRYMIIAVFQGEGWNSRGLVTVPLAEPSRDMILRFDDKSYQTWGTDEGTRVNVFAFFVVPKSNNALILEENVQRILGRPPEWKRRESFPPLDIR